MDQMQVRHEPGPTAARVGRVFDPVSESKALLWDVPGAGTLAWIAAHITAAAVFLATVLSASTRPWWLVTLLVLWVGLLSVLVGRVTRAVLFGDRDRDFRIDKSLTLPFVRTPLRAGLFVAATYAAIVLPLGVSSTLAGASAGFVAVTTGARFAGLDAWEGALRPRWHYVNSVVSKSGFSTVVIFVSLSGLVFAALGNYTDWLAGADDVAHRANRR